MISFLSGIADDLLWTYAAIWFIVHLRYSNDKRKRSDRALIIALLLAILGANKCNAQDTRWRLIQPTQRDSIVAVPLHDLRVAGGYRIAKNVSQRQCAWELVERAKELESARQTIEAKNAALFKKDEVIVKMREANDAITARARKAEKKVKRRKPWLFFGLGAATLYAVQQQMK